MKESKADSHVLAGGGIVTRDSARPLVALVRLRKDNSWVLPKGKLKQDERVLAAAKREVEEETGHDVTVLGFLGALSHISDDRHKIVQFWHMSASPAPVRPLSDDVKAVKWLPLRQAIETLSRPHERVFLSSVGPLAVKAAEESRRARLTALAARTAPPLQEQVTRPRRRTAALRGTIAAWLKKRLQRFDRRARGRQATQ